MRLLKIILLLLFWSSPFFLGTVHAQVVEGEPEEVIAKLTLSTSQNLNGSYSSFLNELMTDFNIVVYQSAFPGANSEKLQMYRSFIPADLLLLPQLKSKLLASSFFDFVEIQNSVPVLGLDETPSLASTDCNAIGNYQRSPFLIYRAY